MIYSFKLDRLPEICKIYVITRKTVWKIADENNILVMILSGSCCFEINSKKYIVNKGEFFFIPANTTYERSPYEDQNCKMIYIHFKTNNEMSEFTDEEAYANIEKDKNEAEISFINKNELFPPSYNIYLKNHMTENDELHKIVGKIEMHLKQVTIENSLKIVLHLCNILYNLSKEMIDSFEIKTPKEKVMVIPHNLKKAVLYIKQNSHKKISVTELAKYCNISQSQLTRYFKAVFNKTPIQYINDYKLNRAKHMLMNMPQISVSVVAESFGFDDQQYFSRLFSKTFNETPTSYRYRANHYFKKTDTDPLRNP